jgi:hypothetical protein
MRGISMHTFYIGNPISMILGYSCGLDNSVYFVVQEDHDLRKSHRDTSCSLELQELIATYFGLSYSVISFEDFENAYRSETGFVTEFRFISYFRKKFGGILPHKVQAISYGADLLLAGDNLFHLLRGPRHFKVIYSWKKELKSCLNIESFWIPQLNRRFEKIAGIPVKQISRSVLLENLKTFGGSGLFSEFLGVANLGVKPLVMVGPDYYGFDKKNADSLVARIKEIANLDEYEILLKPHPASQIQAQMIDYFEDRLGRETLNSVLNLDMNRVKTTPLEVFMAANDSNLYVGIYTAGVSMASKDKVKWVPGSDEFAEKMYKINYRTFITSWSK